MTTKITPTNSPYTIERPFEEQTVRFTVTFKDGKPEIDATLRGTQISISDFSLSKDEQLIPTFFQDQPITLLKDAIVFLPKTPLHVYEALKAADLSQYSVDEQEHFEMVCSELTPFAQKYMEASDLDECVEACLELGQAYFTMGEPYAALRCYNEVLAIGKELFCNEEMRCYEGGAYLNLCVVWAQLEEFERAISCGEKSVKIFHGDKNSENIALNILGKAYHESGKLPIAIEFYNRALASLSPTGCEKEKGQILNNLGSANLEGGDTIEAFAFFDKALKIFCQTDSKKDEGDTYNNLGNAHSKLGQVPEAIAKYEEALKIYRLIGDKVGEDIALQNLKREKALI